MSSGTIFKVWAAGLVFATSLQAIPVPTFNATYTFEKPNFTLNQTAPLLDIAPNTGVPGLLTSFSGVFTVSEASPQGPTFPPAFSGMFLSQTGEPGSITLNFNTPILSLSVDFALLISSFSDTGWINYEGSDFWGGEESATFPDTYYQGGTLLIDPGHAFSSVTLSGMNSNESRQFFALDNLQIQTQAVPEPSTWAAIIAVGGIGGWQCARQFAGRGKQP